VRGARGGRESGTDTTYVLSGEIHPEMGRCDRIVINVATIPNTNGTVAYMARGCQHDEMRAERTEERAGARDCP